jgi:hypothetical protein
MSKEGPGFTRRPFLLPATLRALPSSIDGDTIVRYHALLTLALVGGVMAGPAQAQQAQPGDMSRPFYQWKQVSGWVVAVDRTDNSCFIVSVGTGPTIRVGFIDADRKFNVFLTHSAWESIEVGREYSMTLQVDDRPYTGPMDVTQREDGRKFLRKTFTDGVEGRQFLVSFQAGSRLTVLFEGRQIAAYGLRGTHVAGEELKRCQATIDQRAPAGGSAKPPAAVDEDPFKRR